MCASTCPGAVAFDAIQAAVARGHDWVIVAKLDGTAKGGIVLGITGRFGIPARSIGTGETIDDLEAFDPDTFARLMFEE